MDSLKFPTLLNRTTYEQTLPISLKTFGFHSEVLRAPKMLKDFVHQFHHKKEIFYLQERYTNKELELHKIFFFNSYIVDIFLFVTAIISILVTTKVMYILCKHMKYKSLVARLALQQRKEEGVVSKQESVTLAPNVECTCKIQ